jgi:hypothetical protein
MDMKYEIFKQCNILLIEILKYINITMYLSIYAYVIYYEWSRLINSGCFLLMFE